LKRGSAVGSNAPRADGPSKVRGEALFPQDLPVEGCLSVATVRSGVAHALLGGIDTASALKVPGVLRILTCNDVRGSNRYGLVRGDQPVLAEDRVRTSADVVALVVAETEQAAREGARRVRVALEPLPVLANPALACRHDAPIVHPARDAGRRHPNLLSERIAKAGDAMLALATAPLVVEASYETGWVEHAFLAPEAGVAGLDGQGHLTLWTATQWPAEDLRQAALALGEPLERLRLVQQTIGGAFGGREDISLQLLLLLAARETGRRVRMVWDRAESMRGHGKRHPFQMRYRLAADGEGRFLALHAELLVDAGGYASTSDVVLANAVEQASGPYAIEHVLVEGRAVYTNNPITCAFRGFGVNQVNFAMEQTVNRLAARLGQNPIEIRRRNIVRRGGRLATGHALDGGHGLFECLDQVAQRATRIPLSPNSGAWRHGRGFACAVKNTGYAFGFDDHATARITLTTEGALIHAGAAEVGQGVETVLAQIAADAMGIPAENVRVAWQDTLSAPDAGSSSASHQTVVSGNAVLLAAERARRLVDDLGGFGSLPAGGITVEETYHAPKTYATLTGGKAIYAYSWSACLADVAVDLETGRVRVLRVVEAVDAGRVINPLLFTAQVEGGVVMGQGYALQERFDVREAVPLTASLGECLIPTSLDAAPIIEVIAVESPDPEGPHGARGIGEVTMLPVVPALTAAIQAATGAWVDRLPALPERVLIAVDGLERAPTDVLVEQPTPRPCRVQATPERSQAG